MKKTILTLSIILIAGVATYKQIIPTYISQTFAHGDVAPQPVDIEGLKKLGEEWLTVNPYKQDNNRALQIGCTAYNQNCARCHGLGAISGGVAPDIRWLEDDPEGDEWYISRVRKGYHQNGITKMPAFEGLMPQEAMWAIRTYASSRPDEDEDALKFGYNCLDFEKKEKAAEKSTESK